MVQLDHLWNELNNNYSGVLNTMKTGKSIKEVSDDVLLRFEVPRDKSNNVKNLRARYGQEIYDELNALSTNYYGPATPEHLKAGGSGEGTSLSRRDRYRIKKANNVAHGGYGSTIDYGSISSKYSSTSSTQYKNAQSAKRYINTTRDSSTNALLINAIEILATIAGNTSITSKKLDALNYLQNLSSQNNNNVTNIFTPQGNVKSTKTANVNTNERNEKRGEIVARQIALGGY